MSHVDKPKHYDVFPGVQALDIIRKALTPEEYQGFLKGNILKYRMRAGEKDDLKQDIDKANWYRDALYAVEDGSGGVISVKCDGPDWSGVAPGLDYAAKPLTGGAWSFTSDPNLFNRMGGFGVRHYRFSDSFDEQRMDRPAEYSAHDYPGTLANKR